MNTIFHILFVALFWVIFVLSLTGITIFFYGDYYDPKDEVLHRVAEADREMWRKQLDDERRKAANRTMAHMTYVALFIAFLYWIYEHQK